MNFIVGRRLRMKTYFALILANLCACNEHIKYLGETEKALVQNGLRMVISSPKQVYKNDFLSMERIEIEVSNFSSDTIFFQYFCF